MDRAMLCELIYSTYFQAILAVNNCHNSCQKTKIEGGKEGGRVGVREEELERGRESWRDKPGKACVLLTVKIDVTAQFVV